MGAQPGGRRMGINSESNVAANLQIGPTSLGMVRLYIEADGLELPLDFEPDEAEEVTLNPADLRIDTYRASGAGGQHINKTDSAVRVTHIPTGLVAECQDDRSQHRNKAKALAVLGARLRDKDRLERQARDAATRKGLIGSGDRSDRIRTYNFPQGRLTDHRINLTLYKLGAVMEGELDDVIAALKAARAAELLAEMEAQG